MKGSYYVSEKAMRMLLKARCADGLRAFCREHDLDPGHISNVINGHKPVSETIATVLGYEPVILYRKGRAP